MLLLRYLIATTLNPTPEQLRKRELNRRYLQSLTPEKLKALNERKKNTTKQRYQHLAENDADFILENREKVLEWRKKQGKNFMEKEKLRLKQYRDMLTQKMEEGNLSIEEARNLFKKKQWVSRQEIVDEMLFEDYQEDQREERKVAYMAFIIKTAAGKC